MTPRIHHFGLLVQDVEKFLSRSIWELHGPIVSDPIQRARLCLVIPSGDASEPLVELIQPLDEQSPTWKHVASGQSWHHVCFTVPTMAAGDEYMTEKRLMRVTPWHPAVLFEGRAIRFALSRNGEILEFLSDEVPG